METEEDASDIEDSYILLELPQNTSLANIAQIELSDLELPDPKVKLVLDRGQVENFHAKYHREYGTSIICGYQHIFATPPPSTEAAPVSAIPAPADTTAGSGGLVFPSSASPPSNPTVTSGGAEIGSPPPEAIDVDFEWIGNVYKTIKCRRILPLEEMEEEDEVKEDE